MSGDQDRRSLPERAAASGWVATEAGLLDAVTGLVAEQVPAHQELASRAVDLAQLGRLDPWRLARHATAASVSRALRLATGLPAAVSTRRPLSDPGGWARDVAVEAFVDQLALGGPASAELARLIEGGGALFPEPLRRELGRRHIRALDLPPGVAQAVADRAFTATPSDTPASPVQLTDATPLIGTPVSALYPASGHRGSLLVRVRRPRIAGDLLTDSRLAAGAAAAVSLLSSDVAPVAPIGFIRLVLRQNLEAIDLRFESLALIELGLLVEAAGRPGLVVARPRPGLISERALGVEAVEGVPLTAWRRAHQRAEIDLAAVVPALLAVTVESALAHGVFWADPAPEHLLVRPDGRLALVGAGTLGRFTPELRLAGVRTIKAVLTGDFAGMLDGLRLAGAIGPEVDTAGLVADLSANARLDPMKLLLGGEGELLSTINSLVEILLAHRLEPPVEVTLLLRSLFALGRLLSVLAPEGGPGLTGALVALVPRLPDLLNEDMS